MDEAHGLALEQRGLSVELAVRHGWRPCSGPTDGLWIAIPIIDKGKRVGTKYRTITGEKRFSQDAGTPQIFWNVDCLRDPSLAGFPLIITEGEMDALAALQCGFPKVVSVPGGAPERDAHEGMRWNFLTHAHAELRGERTVILAVDNDRNGDVLQAGLARRLGKSRCQVLEYPTGKDLNDVLRDHGADAVRTTIAQAHYLPVPGLVRLIEAKEAPLRRALDSCIPGLEPHLRVRRGDLIVVTGPPGHGKSSFVNNLVCNMAWHWATTAVICSLEQPVVPDLRRVFRSFRAECLEKFMSEDQQRQADDWINQNFLFVEPDEDEDTTLDWMLERFAVAAHRHGATVCVIDPWNEVSTSDKPDEWTVEQFVSQSLRAIKRFARKHDVTMIVVAHPRKMSRDKSGKMPKPSLYDIADSAAWFNRADLGVVVYRPDLLNESLTEISVEKSRNFYVLGIPGIVTLQWQPEVSRFIKPWHSPI
jgi:twinkle protein